MPLVLAQLKKATLKVLKWAYEHGCPWDRWTCAEAAHGGHLEILKWARSKGCPWDSDTCLYAVYKGHLDVLKWLRSQNPPCPWNKSECLHWAYDNHAHIVDWIRSLEEQEEAPEADKGALQACGDGSRDTESAPEVGKDGERANECWVLIESLHDSLRRRSGGLNYFNT